MTKNHEWEHERGPYRTTRYGFGPCVKCGQDFETQCPTTRCVCWKMRLPTRKEK